MKTIANKENISSFSSAKIKYVLESLAKLSKIFAKINEIALPLPR